MKAWILVAFLSIGHFLSEGQNSNAIWVFGDSTGIDFNSSTNPQTITTVIRSLGTCASIADSAGQLIMYAFTRRGQGDHSARIYNSNNVIIEGGDTIVGEGNMTEMIIVPMPNSPGVYYVFSTGMVFTSIQGFYYTVVDMNLNGGLGKVIQKNVQLNNFRNADAVKAIKHGNGRDWWVLSKYSSSPPSSFNRFYLYLITPSGISQPLIEDLNNALDGDLQKLTFNPEGSKLMQVNILGLMCEYDFDRCTGIISNPNIIFTEQSSNYDRTFWEGAYSPNGNIFYISTTDYPPLVDTINLLQYDLQSVNIPLSCDTLDVFIPPIGTGAVRLASDGKIYFTRFYEWGFPGYPYPDSVYNQVNMNLSVINSPDSLGAACNYQPFSFYLGGKRTYYGLPNNPDYTLGPITGSICDTLTSSVLELAGQTVNLYIYYNPQWDIAFINASGLKQNKINMTVADISGRIIYNEFGTVYSGYYTKDLTLNGFAKGMYIVTIQTGNQMLSKKFVTY